MVNTRTGKVVAEYGPWLVVDPFNTTRIRSRHVVVDGSGPRPVRVFGPASRKDCEAWASVSWQLLRTVHGQVAG